jgi:Flp pilus assembly protein TadG
MIRFRPVRSGSMRRERSRGQSLVEFALVIPILLFLTLIALDFGRVYLGYINLQNMARIAANFAGNNPTAWDGVVVANDAKLKTKYYNQIMADAAAINCSLIDASADLHRPNRQRLHH